MNRKRGLLATASAVVLLGSLAACGSDSDGGSKGDAGGGSDSYILGTTETVTAMDPAGSYDFGSWNLQYSVFQQLLTVPAGSSTPEPNAAESCAYDSPRQVTCKLKPGLKFSNGDDLTSSDVVFSFKRNIEIADPNGSSVLLGQLMAPKANDNDPQKLRDSAIEAPDDTTVVFHLATPDTTFLQLLTTATTSIVDEDVFPADKLLEDDKVIGSGPYALAQWKKGEQAVLEANSSYAGTAPATKQVFIQYFSDPAPLKQAIESKQVDIAWRTLSPTDLNDLAGKDGVEVIHGKGSEFRYWVFQFGTPTGGNKAIRQAVAQIIDRDAIAKDAYDGTVTPSYSIVPPGFAGQKDSFKEKWGDAPDVDGAKATLAAASVKTPVEIHLGYTPTHYGPNAVDEATQLADQLNATGLFKATTDQAEWEEYQTLYKKNAYDLFMLGWYPDILDPDNYLTPFIRDGGFFANGYHSAKVNALLTKELAQTDAAKRAATIGQLQDIVAEDIPLVPSWNGQNVAVAVDGMQGVEETLDPTYIFRLWQISKD